MKQIFAAHLSNLYRLLGFGCHFVASARKDCTQPEHFTGGSRTQGHAAAALRTHRKAYPSRTEKEYTTGRLVFPKKYGSPRKGLERLNPIEFLESIGRQIAKNTIRALYAIETALRHNFSPSQGAENIQPREGLFV